MYTIREFAHKTRVSSVDELMRELGSKSGSLSVIWDQENGLNKIAYVDIADGVIRQSYGEQRVLKASDFSLDGQAFR